LSPLNATLGIAQPFREAGLWRFGTFEPDQLEPHTAHDPETKSEEVTGKLQHLSQALGAMDKGLSPGGMSFSLLKRPNFKARLRVHEHKPDRGQPNRDHHHNDCADDKPAHHETNVKCRPSGI
jgi:hypothetical protein